MARHTGCRDALDVRSAGWADPWRVVAQLVLALQLEVHPDDANMLISVAHVDSDHGLGGGCLGSRACGAS